MIYFVTFRVPQFSEAAAYVNGMMADVLTHSRQE
jgi:hypothetical protein